MKNLLLIGMFYIFFVGQANAGDTRYRYKVGQRGPGGGVIFFVDYNNEYARFNYLEAAPENSVIILHGCAHNPSGMDLTMEQWIVLSNLFKVIQTRNFHNTI